MKTWKRNAIIAMALVLVCAGIYLNWQLGNAKAVALTDTLDADKIMGEDTLVMSQLQTPAELAAKEGLSDTVTGAEYFAQMRLSRQESRDEAVELLQEAMAVAGEDEEAGASSSQLDSLVSRSLAEAQIESLVISKGYTDCVAYMSDSGISLAVAAPESGLLDEDVALLTDIITAQSDYSLAEIRIIEVK